MSLVRVVFTARSPEKRRRYSWMPSKVNAHARGEVNFVTGLSACSNKCPQRLRYPAFCERPMAVPSAAQGKLEQIAPGSVAAYQPVIYPDNLVAVVGYDPWVTPDGTLRP